MRLTADSIVAALTTTFTWHDRFSRTRVNRFRRFDGKTPTGVHPALCGLLMLHEELIPERDRVVYAEALFGHDFLEDTKGDLPKGTSPRVRKLINEMTLPQDLTVKEQWDRIWAMSREGRLLKLYDKFTSVMQPGPDQKREAYKRRQLRALAARVRRDFGNLNIIGLAYGACNQRRP